MLETGMLIGMDMNIIYIHEPANRNVVSLPDSRELWDVIWENRNNVLGFAHSHPGSSIPGPSWEDITTFSAVELAIGKRILWWITSYDSLILCQWGGTEKYDYSVEIVKETNWVHELRNRSGFRL